MRKNAVVRKSDAKKWKTIAALAVLAVSVAALWWLFLQIRAAFIAQCEIKDVERQVKVVTRGRLVKEGVVLEMFGIRKGRNLALIDFAAKRKAVLAKYPAIRDVVITRHLPDRVEIVLEERVAAVRIGEIDARRVSKGATGRVADADGVVFMQYSLAGPLPAIYEKSAEKTKSGRRLPPRAMAALRLLTLARESPYSDLGIQRVDVDRRDCLYAVLGDYSGAKIAWEGMDDGGEKADKAMAKQLKRLRDSFMSGVVPSLPRPVVWNATEPDRVFADTKEPIL